MWLQGVWVYEVAKEEQARSNKVRRLNCGGGEANCLRDLCFSVAMAESFSRQQELLTRHCHVLKDVSTY